MSIERLKSELRAICAAARLRNAERQANMPRIVGERSKPATLREYFARRAS